LEKRGGSEAVSDLQIDDGDGLIRGQCHQRGLKKMIEG
jgi:hypothetical protein